MHTLKALSSTRWVNRSSESKWHITMLEFVYWLLTPVSYPVHFHMCGDVDELGGYSQPAYVKKNSIHRSLSRCVTIHGYVVHDYSDIFANFFSVPMVCSCKTTWPMITLVIASSSKTALNDVTWLITTWLFGLALAPCCPLTETAILARQWKRLFLTQTRSVASAWRSQLTGLQIPTTSSRIMSLVALTLSVSGTSSLNVPLASPKPWVRHYWYRIIIL